MIRHIVLIKFHADLSEARIADIWAELRSLTTTMQGVHSVTYGKSESPEQLERGYMHGFVIDFESWDALAHYADHPAHRAFGARLVAHAQGGLDGLLVFDLPIVDLSTE